LHIFDVGEQIMRRRSEIRSFLLLIAVLLCPIPSLGQTQNDKDLARRTDELLVTYATFKNYPAKDAATTYRNLTEDRQAVFDAIVRALFVPLQDKKGVPGKRVVDFVEEVRGIWGVRSNQTEGRYMFRVSMRFAPTLKAALQASSNIPKSRFTTGHVLMPVAEGGDDDPAFTGFKALLKESGVSTFREAGDPSLQISLLDDDPQIGEADIDFDPKGFPCGCHCRPSNSDVGSKKSSSSTDVHLTMFNSDITYFSAALATTWSRPAAHCKWKY
jgi:hypothetical protein